MFLEPFPHGQVIGFQERLQDELCHGTAANITVTHKKDSHCNNKDTFFRPFLQGKIIA